MEDKKKLAAPCGLYCGVCGVYMAHRDNNLKFQERLVDFYQKGLGAPTLGVDDIRCDQCSDFPCKFIDDFPIPVGKKVILRAIPFWREYGTERWMEEEEKRYNCPYCGYALFRGAQRCRNCKEPVDVD